MCLIVLAVDAHPEYPLLLVANRDEFHRRPTAPASFWPDAPAVLAGRDLEAGGAWLGITRNGRFAALTNFREPGRHRPDAPSRGPLVAEFLTGATAAEPYLVDVVGRGHLYNGFSLLAGDRDGLWYCSNRDGPPRLLGQGVHGLSNHLLDTPWPKVVRSTGRLRALARSGQPVVAADLLTLLDDRRLAPDDELPSTGVPLEWERLLSAPCIVSPDYGTRSSTALTIARDGWVVLVEQTRDPGGDVAATRSFSFRIEP